MFGIFKSKERKMVDKLSELSREIESAGGSLVVCRTFSEWFHQNELREILGVVSDTQSPYSKLILMTAGLKLLNDVQQMRNELDESTADAALSFAETAYIGSAFLVEDDVLLPVLAEIKQTNIIPKAKLDPYLDLYERHKIAWVEFNKGDVDLRDMSNF
ncbi:hypothetical protein [Polynucleobacter sp. MWH-Braz-FAM2G]|uniref:hypothetical protein n=1 Tax=Polynucleobacter sp. MWH-Braz-FAM2G TaxID=1855883 RepID=UPI001BFCF6C3|nr:hypothetical protein [Polynucleobacter sp. MWH-Braz-FAM2G]QWD91773.1 hypothetical protein FD973_05525 [Polynucleobacter sp. MWH-Braz-FAM2G]